MAPMVHSALTATTGKSSVRALRRDLGQRLKAGAATNAKVAREPMTVAPVSALRGCRTGAGAG